MRIEKVKLVIGILLHTLSLRMLQPQRIKVCLPAREQSPRCPVTSVENVRANTDDFRVFIRGRTLMQSMHIQIYQQL